MRRILVVGADQLSRWVDWDDRRSCVLFGDAAGALVLEGSDNGEDDLGGFLLRSDGSRGEVLQLPHRDERAPLVGRSLPTWRIPADPNERTGGVQVRRS